MIFVMGGGYLHPDAQWQYLEPAFKYAKGFGALPWEFNSQFGGARSWIIPGCIYILLKCFLFLKIDDPFLWIYTLRFFLALLSLVSIYSIFHITKILDNERTAYLAALYAAVWGFFAFFNLQLHGEMIAIAFVLLAHLFCLKASSYPDHPRLKQLYLGMMSGISLGFVFVAKYHVAVFGFTLLGYLLFKKKYVSAFMFCIGVMMVILIQGIVDYFTWHKFLASFFNYYHDVTGEDTAKPFYTYIGYTVKILSPILFPCILFYFYHSFKKLNLIHFSLVLYFIIHSLVGHKLLRYISPITPFFFILIPIGYFYFFKNTLLSETAQIRLKKLTYSLFFIALIPQYIPPFLSPFLNYPYQYPHWTKNSELVKATYIVGKQQDSTGVMYINRDDTGYFYLNKNIPIYTGGSEKQTIKTLINIHLNLNYIVYKKNEKDPITTQDLKDILNEHWEIFKEMKEHIIFRKTVKVSL